MQRDRRHASKRVHDRHKGRLLWTLAGGEIEEQARARHAHARGSREIIAARLKTGEEILFANEAGEPHYSGRLVGPCQLRTRRERLPIAEFTTHDLRRTTATMMTAQLELPFESVAALVGHTVGGAQNQHSGSALHPRRLHRPQGDRALAMGPAAAGDLGQRGGASDPAASPIGG